MRVRRLEVMGVTGDTSQWTCFVAILEARSHRDVESGLAFRDSVTTSSSQSVMVCFLEEKYSWQSILQLSSMWSVWVTLVVVSTSKHHNSETLAAHQRSQLVLPGLRLNLGRFNVKKA